MDLSDAKELDDTEKENDTLYNFGYAPKEVIEKFQCFCYQHSTLTDAIQSLLKRDKLLKCKYRFITAPITYQMLAKPTIYDVPNLLKTTMLSLHKYMKQNRYKSVADAIEELLFAIDKQTITCNVGVNTSECFDYDCTSLSLLEQEALSKIADAVIFKLNDIEKSPVRKKPKKTESNKKEINQKSKSPKEKKSASPKEKKSASPKEKKHKPFKDNDKCFKSASLLKTKPKIKKLSDPDYNPDGRKCLWDKMSHDANSNISTNNFVSSNSNQSIPYDIELITPLKNLKQNQLNNTPTTIFDLDAVSCEKDLFMFRCLGLRPQDAEESD